MDNRQIDKLITWIQETEIGAGDLTTESVAPYALHATGHFIINTAARFSGRPIIERLLAPYQDRLKISWQKAEGEQLQAGDMLFEFQGNGAAILNNRRLIAWIIGRLSRIATDTATAVDFLKEKSKKLVSGRFVSPLYGILDNQAFQTGGGELLPTNLYDSLHITPAHVIYADQNLPGIIKQINQDLGGARKTLHIHVEVNTLDQFREADQCNIDAIHLVNMNPIDIKHIFTKEAPHIRPIMHIKNLKDWQESYTDYFFRYVAVEELHRKIAPLPLELIFDRN